MEGNAKTKVGYWNHQPSGCFWYRTETPMSALKRAGIDVEMLEIDKDVDIYKFQSVQFYGAYPFSMGKIVKFLKQEGVKIVYDTDDALDIIDETNPFFYAVKKDAGSVQEILDYADEVTVSTPKMAEYIAKKTKAKITVVPNCYTPNEWKVFRQQHDDIRIGFAGSGTHVPDLIEIIPVIKRLQEKYNVKFYIMGFGMTEYSKWLKDFRYLANEKANEKLMELDSLLKTIKYEWIPFVDYHIYPQTLTNLGLDIGLCPLKDTPFNQCRSACKSMEYTLSGTLALASDIPVYSTEGNSVIVNNWEEKIEHYINNKQDRISKLQQHLDWTTDKRNIDNQIDLLKSIYIV